MIIDRKTVKRIMAAKKACGKGWDQIASEAGIPVASWMTGAPYTQPTEEEVRKLAPVLNTTFEELIGEK